MRLLATLIVASAGVAAAPAKLAWEHEGYPRILTAAAAAKRDGKRLLLGLSGAPS